MLCVYLVGSVTENKLIKMHRIRIRTVHFGMKLYNDQSNAQAINLFMYLPLPYMYRTFF
jgi:hypothetical protein